MPQFSQNSSCDLKMGMFLEEEKLGDVVLGGKVELYFVMVKSLEQNYQKTKEKKEWIR